jgi:hypothetical protein
MPIDVLFLLGLPASGKSEIRRYLFQLPPPLRLADFGLGGQVEVDDFPYVWAMRSIDRELRRHDLPPVFFESDHLPLIDARGWLALALLAAEDVDDLARRRVPTPERPGAWLLGRIEGACRAVGMPPLLEPLTRWVSHHLHHELEPQARAQLEARRAHAEALDEGGPITYVIELARGGPGWMKPPLPAPLGYAATLPMFGRELLARATILHVAVSPSESRRRNRERADPKDPGSSLAHTVPEAVMQEEYGCDDLDWLAAASDRPGTVALAFGETSSTRALSRAMSVGGETIHVPIVRFDNERDATSFARAPIDRWPADSVRRLHEELAAAFADASDLNRRSDPDDPRSARPAGRAQGS